MKEHPYNRILGLENFPGFPGKFPVSRIPGIPDFLEKIPGVPDFLEKFPVSRIPGFPDSRFGFLKLGLIIYANYHLHLKDICFVNYISCFDLFYLFYI